MSNDSLRMLKLRRSLLGFNDRISRVTYPVAVSCCTTIITFAFGVCAVLVFQETIPSESWLGIWKRWDASHFLDLAQHGYPHQAGNREHLIVWLPVFPMAIRVAHLFIPEWHAVAVVLSNCCCAAALIYLFLLGANGIRHRGGATRRALLRRFPTAYFLHIAYSESIFLLLTVGRILLRAAWTVAGLWSPRHARYWHKNTGLSHAAARGLRISPAT